MIRFRPIRMEDISTVIDWIRNDHVIDVWDSAQGVEDRVIRKKYEQRMQSSDIETFIIVYDDLDIGLIQTYRISNHQDFGIATAPAMGIDLFIGRVDHINRHIGRRVIQSFLRLHVFSHSDVHYACIDPEVANERAIRAYEAVGFIAQTVKFCSRSMLLTCYMTLDRDAFYKKKA